MRSDSQSHADLVLLDSIIDELESKDTTSEHRNTERKQTVLHKFDVRMVDEYCDWLIESSKKDFKKKEMGIKSSSDQKDDADD